MKIEVELDRLEDFLFWHEPRCEICLVRFNNKIDCPYKNGTTSRILCDNAIMKYLKGE